MRWNLLTLKHINIIALSLMPSYRTIIQTFGSASSSLSFRCKSFDALMLWKVVIKTFLQLHNIFKRKKFEKRIPTHFYFYFSIKIDNSTFFNARNFSIPSYYKSLVFNNNNSKYFSYFLDILNNWFYIIDNRRPGIIIHFKSNITFNN